jgi:predicted transcriptional regulator of viral defense system
MSVEPSREYLRLIDLQAGVLAIGQAIEAGLTHGRIRNQVRSGRWQLIHRGVYATSNGAPSRQAELWGALLRAGPDAVLSHETAAEVHGLIDGQSRLIHLTVAHDHRPERCGRIPGVVVHRSRTLARTRHPVLSPPRTRVEETVLDLIECARTLDDAYDWICRAIGRRRTTAPRLLSALRARRRFRWRRHIELALGYADGGALSFLELRYKRGVEHPHGIPAAKRQVRVGQAAGNRYLDNLYEDHRACVEIDGAAAHPEDEQWQDKSRDRWNSVHEGIETIRIGVRDLWTQQARCETAADVAKWLTGRGTPVGHPCPRPDCPVQGLGVPIAL